MDSPSEQTILNPEIPALMECYRQVLSGMEQDLMSRPDENWELIHQSTALSANQKLLIKIQNSHPSFRERLHHEFLGDGPLPNLLQDPQVTEILLIGESKIWFEKDGRLQVHDDKFLGPLTFQRFFNRCLDEAAVVVDLKRPYGDGVWREFRLHVTLPPLSEEVCMSLRRQRQTGWMWPALVERGWAQEKWCRDLSDWFRAGKSFIIYGDTGSGKTATAEALLHTLPENCRAIILEDTRELRPPNKASLRLTTRLEQGDLEEISYSDLLRQSLRMRPDRLIMGEIRGSEAKDFLMVLASGHCGGLATLHAESAPRVLLRLEMLVQLGAPQWDLRSVRLLIAHSIQYLVKVGRDPEGVRRLLAIDKIDGLEETGFLLDSIPL